MKIAILGAGAMGSIYGARLKKGGADVTLLDVNDAHIDAINTNGLHISIDEGNSTVHLPAMRPEDCHTPVDLILLFTKTFHTDAALASVKNILKGTAVLSLQNGIGNVERISAHVPKEGILVGMTMTPAEFIGPGRVASHGAASTSLYGVDGNEHPILKDIIDVMSKGGIDAKADPNIDIAIWEKATFNCTANSLCALSGATPGAIGVSEKGRILAKQVAQEVINVAQASGTNASLERVMALLEHAFSHHLHHEPSMLQDRNAARRTEIDALNGAVVKMGDVLNVPVETNRILSNLIALMEDSAVFRAKHS
ncbi:MAG: ketopantoate reductase family protein [Pseudomonas marincola]